MHGATLLALLPPDKALPAGKLAEFHGVPAAYLAKHLQSLSRAGIVESVPGRGAGTGWRGRRRTSRCGTSSPPSRAPNPRFRCTEIRQRGPAAFDSGDYRSACTITPPCTEPSRRGGPS